MAGPRFLFTTRIASTPDGGTGVAWRLVGGNNHELGRSASVFALADDCVEAVHHLRTGAGRLVAETVTAQAPMRWGWSLLLDGATVAVSCRWYRREREGAYNLTQFLAAAPVAVLSDVVAGVPQRRELLRPDFLLPHLSFVQDEPSPQDQLTDVVTELPDQHVDEAVADPGRAEAS